MKKYDYKEEIMFFLWDSYTTTNYNDGISDEISKYFKNKYNIMVNCDGKDKEYINIKFITGDNYVLINFKYDESLFYNCYKSDGIYECEKYKGTRAIIHKLWQYLFDKFLIITKKEPLLCHECGKQIGIIFNDFDADEKSIGAGGKDGDDPKKLYDYDDESINKCHKCGEYFCEDCSRDFYNGFYFYNSVPDFICKDCEDDEDDGNIDDEYYEEDLIDKWGYCKFDDDDENKPDSCEDCDYYEDCIDSAEDNRDGYSAFCDCIVGHGYDSMDDFWECNGI